MHHVLKAIMDVHVLLPHAASGRSAEINLSRGHVSHQNGMPAGRVLFYSTVTSGDSNSPVESRTVAFSGSYIKGRSLVRGQQAQYKSTRLVPMPVGSTTVSVPSVTSVHRRRRGGRAMLSNAKHSSIIVKRGSGNAVQSR